MLVGPEGPMARSPNREILNCSVAWTPVQGRATSSARKGWGVVRRKLADTPDRGGRSERMLITSVSKQQSTS